jgi:hypothetical protein
MIAEKKINKAFNRCINRLKSSDTSGLPVLMERYVIEEYIDIIKRQRGEYLKRVSSGRDSDNKNLEQYEKELFIEMIKFIEDKLKREVVPKLKKEVKEMEEVLIKLNEFRSDVLMKGQTDFEHQTHDNWGGAGVVVTSDPKFTGKECDLVVLTNTPRPIVWLMISLAEICSPLINWSNKYEFYRTIAEIAEGFIDEKGNLSETKGFFRMSIEKVIEFVQAFDPSDLLLSFE